MISPEASTLTTLVIYALGTVAALCGMCMRRPRLRRAGCWLSVLGFASQTLFLLSGFHKIFPGGLPLGAYLQLLAWFLLLCGIIIWARWHADTPLLFAAPLCLILYAMSRPALALILRAPSSVKHSFYVLHIGTLFMSLALIGIAAIVSFLFLVLEKRIKNKQQMKGFWRDLPSLSILDRVNAIAVLLAFPLFTIGIASGLQWSEPVFGAAVGGDPKEIVSVVIWLLLAFIFHGRLANGWKGRKPAVLMISVSLLCLFSILVVNNYMNTHHSFIKG